jgi:hypothetical protein
MTTLSLVNNDIGTEGAEAIAEALKANVVVTGHVTHVTGTAVHNHV